MLLCETCVVVCFPQILQTFAAEPGFEENHKDMIVVLESIAKQMISDQNEGFALKVHYLSYLIQQYHAQGMQTLMKRYRNCSNTTCVQLT